VSKSRRHKLNKREDDNPTTSILQRLHIDLSGPHVTIKSRFKYYLIIIDAHSKFTHIEILRKKNKTPNKIQLFILTIQQQTNVKIQTLHLDNSREFNNKKLQFWFKHYNFTSIQYSTLYKQEQNGLAKRFIQTLNNMVTCMLLQSKLLKSFWAKAITYTTYINNYISKKTLDHYTSL
jgi:transposase InsO family protein